MQLPAELFLRSSRDVRANPPEGRRFLSCSHIPFARRHFRPSLICGKFTPVKVDASGVNMNRRAFTQTVAGAIVGTVGLNRGVPLFRAESKPAIDKGEATGVPFKISVMLW